MMPVTVISGVTGRLAVFWNYADQVPMNGTNQQGCIGNSKTLSTAESLLCFLCMMRILLVVLHLSIFLMENLILRKQTTLESYCCKKCLSKPKPSSRQVRGKIYGKIMLLCLGWGRKAHLLVVIDIWGFVCLRGLIHLFIRDNCRKKLSKIVFFMKEMKQSVACNDEFFCFFSMLLTYFCASP